MWKANRKSSKQIILKPSMIKNAEILWKYCLTKQISSSMYQQLPDLAASLQTTLNLCLGKYSKGRQATYFQLLSIMVFRIRYCEANKEQKAPNLCTFDLTFLFQLQSILRKHFDRPNIIILLARAFCSEWLANSLSTQLALLTCLSRPSNVISLFLCALPESNNVLTLSLRSAFVLIPYARESFSIFLLFCPLQRDALVQTNWISAKIGGFLEQRRWSNKIWENMIKKFSNGKLKAAQSK